MTGSAAVLRLGTRRSALARTQSTWVADRLRAQGYAVELVEILTCLLYTSDAADE